PRLLLCVAFARGRRGPSVAHAERVGDLARGVRVARAPLVAVNFLQPDDRGPADCGVFAQELDDLLQLLAAAPAHVVRDDLQLGGRVFRVQRLRRAADFEKVRLRLLLRARGRLRRQKAEGGDEETERGGDNRLRNSDYKDGETEGRGEGETLDDAASFSPSPLLPLSPSAFHSAIRNRLVRLLSSEKHSCHPAMS